MNNKNTFKKYCPNVFVAKCPEEHKKGELIILTTKYGKEIENEVHNLLGKTNDGYYLYSITRTDGFNSQERAKAKAEKLNGYASNAEKRSNEAYKKSDLSEEATGIVFGQPILVGHHSEARHRKTIERAHRAMDKSIEESRKAEEYQRRSEYWESKAKDINLSMPESLEYYEFKLEEAKKKHLYLKENPEKRAHSYSLTYAKKEVNEMKKNVETAIKLWGTDEMINQMNKEKEEHNKAKTYKNKTVTSLLEEYGHFFFFGSNREIFKEKYNKLREEGYLEEGEKVVHVEGGLYIPHKHLDEFLKKI